MAGIFGSTETFAGLWRSNLSLPVTIHAAGDGGGEGATRGRDRPL